MRYLWCVRGWNQEAIGFDLGCDQTTVSRRIRKLKLEPRANPSGLTLQQTKTIRRMHKAGQPATVIAARINRDARTVRKWLIDQGYVTKRVRVVERGAPADPPDIGEIDGHRSPQVAQALAVLNGRAAIGGPAGFVLDGQPIGARELVQAANEAGAVLRYPGVRVIDHAAIGG